MKKKSKLVPGTTLRGTIWLRGLLDAKRPGKFLKTQCREAKSVYKTSDLILPTLNLGRQAKIRIEVDNDSVRLFIGPRDWQWDRKTGEFAGAGTCLSELRPEK